ncbi:MAG: hypothetical protein V4667_06155 [Bacteroidota bacterium]
MKKFIFLSLTILTCTTFYCKAQSACKKEMSAYLNDPDINGKTNIRKEPKGAIIQQIPANDSYGISIVDAKDGWLKISDLYSYNNEVKLNAAFGWIHSSIVQCGTRNYDGKPIKIYEKSNTASKIIATINQETSVNIIDICNKFAKVSWTDAQKRKLTGWIATEWLCSSPVTNCN